MDGERRFDLNDAPPKWGDPIDPLLPAMQEHEAEIVLAPVKDFIAYGSEVGSPCDNPFCCG